MSSTNKQNVAYLKKKFAYKRNTLLPKRSLWRASTDPSDANNSHAIMKAGLPTNTEADSQCCFIKARKVSPSPCEGDNNFQNDSF